MKISKKRYIQFFCITVVVLGIVRAVKPSVAYSSDQKKAEDSLLLAHNTDKDTTELSGVDDIIADNEDDIDISVERKPAEVVSDDGFVPHKIYSVSSFEKCFPDSNEVQLVAAQKYGVPPVANQAEAERMKDKLVYVGSNPYYYIDNLKSSVPYLVPRASALLQDIGEVFFDSLQIKGIPLHKIIVTSVLRSKEDVEKLQRHNQNATTNSCHQYGTTFDICYNRYKTVEAPDGPKRRAVQNDSLKWVLSEVLNDMRKADRCYIKYEKKQGCYHITVR